MFGHPGEGRTHVVLLVDPGNEGECADLPVVVRRIAAAAREVGGRPTAEWIRGLPFDTLLEPVEDGRGVESARRLKAALDPAGILNPGIAFHGATPRQPDVS